MKSANNASDNVRYLKQLDSSCKFRSTIYIMDHTLNNCRKIVSFRQEIVVIFVQNDVDRKCLRNMESLNLMAAN